MYISFSIGEKGMNIEEIKREARGMDFEGIEQFAREIENYINEIDEYSSISAAYYWASCKNEGWPELKEDENGFFVILKSGDIFYLEQIVENLRELDSVDIICQFLRNEIDLTEHYRCL